MSKVLTILEVSQKQAYIFGSRQLRENAARSQDISYITSGAFFARTAEGLYREGDNLKELSKALERKKARRAASFRTLDLGVEKPGGEAAPDRAG